MQNTDRCTPIEIPVKKKTTHMLESVRSDKIVRFLNSIPQCMATKRHQSGYGKKGDPDISGCLRGRHFEFEVKQPKKQPTLAQTIRMEKWQNCGAIVARVECVDDVLDAFKSHDYPLYEGEPCGK